MNNLSDLSYAKTPIQYLEGGFLKNAGVRLVIKREDLNHRFVSGNKWWKLKYNLKAAMERGHNTLLTFGGAYSNHILATAAAARELGFASIGIIRGEEVQPLNKVLSFSIECGMKLHFISRDEYRGKGDSGFVEELQLRFGPSYVIPEGGTNPLAVNGCEEFGRELKKEKFDYLCLPVGTGGTIAGFLGAFENNRVALGFSVLKGGDFLKATIDALCVECYGREFQNWRLETSYHLGGYAKSTDQLEQFISQFQKDYSIPLEHVYSGKMMFGIFDLIRLGYFKKGSTVLALHTGGLHNQ